MLFVTTQPDNDYYIWQLYVQLNNFKKFGCEDKCIIIFGYNPILGVNPNAFELEKKTEAKVFYYPDRRDLSMRLYLPSIRPHLLKQLYKENPEVIENQNFIYIDCDILLSVYPNFSKLDDENFIHLTSTSSILSIDTIKSKNYELFKKMCNIVGISKEVVDQNKHSAGGITYFFKHFSYLDYEFWDKVEKDSVSLYKMILVSHDNKNSYTQILTANKLAMLWNIWLIGYDTKVSEELSMTWANSPIEEWKNHNFYNNGRIKENEKKILFCKEDFIDKSPFNENLTYVSEKYCSIKYVEEIISTGKALNLPN